jgi:hypothetical protein
MNVSVKSKTAGSSAKKKDIISVGIIGGAGYAGGELIRLLVHHPNTRLLPSTAEAMQAMR